MWNGASAASGASVALNRSVLSCCSFFSPKKAINALQLLGLGPFLLRMLHIPRTDARMLLQLQLPSFSAGLRPFAERLRHCHCYNFVALALALVINIVAVAVAVARVFFAALSRLLMPFAYANCVY